MCRVFIGADPSLWESTTRSFRMDGMVTSVRLEAMFWNALEDIASRQDLNMPQLLHQLYNESIDEGHDLGNFTSFLRVCCMRFLDLQLTGLLPTDTTTDFEALPAEDLLTRERAFRAKAATHRAVHSKQH
ncbi:ribbon-helix-helix domain-containing protein [Pseudorhodobacter aquimaris]|uniref:ribbon-helix-helix domain-containing protein n=1 Tax=Pseudorhodobacter aquimaris TaxID=687412 RepID=UPI00067CFC93|nr:ribbon-helix-helix domain-containing protein [Pseudorhodobacter aquimaris]